MSRTNGNNGSFSNKSAKKIVCRRCGDKIQIIPGKNDNYTRVVSCPGCGTDNLFSVDETGKLHGPASIPNGKKHKKSFSS